MIALATKELLAGSKFLATMDLDDLLVDFPIPATVWNAEEVPGALIGLPSLGAVLLSRLSGVIALNYRILEDCLNGSLSPEDLTGLLAILSEDISSKSSNKFSGQSKRRETYG